MGNCTSLFIWSIMETALYILILLSCISSFVFFIVQAIHYGRSPLSVFSSLLTRSEFNVLLSFVKSGNIEYKEEGFIIQKEFIFVKNYSDIWKLNGARLSFFQEMRLLKACRRTKLKTHLLSKTGSLIYGKE